MEKGNELLDDHRESSLSLFCISLVYGIHVLEFTVDGDLPLHI